MDMKISGSGKITAGEYENIRVAGSSSLVGLIRCKSFHCSGSSNGEVIECVDELKVSGSSRFSQHVNAGSLRVSGSFSCGSDLTVDNETHCSGSLSCTGSLKSGSVKISGSATVKSDVEAERINVCGKINCNGLLNAEEIEIAFDHNMEIGSIGGSKINIYQTTTKKQALQLPFLSWFAKTPQGTVRIKEAIEGDDISLEKVIAPKVAGRIIVIGDGCEIDLVQYSEQVTISPNAKVGRTEKI